MSEQFDLVVLGTGAASAAPAFRARGAGWSVAVVDELPFGGTCALRGCDPKKVLVGAAELVDWSRRMHRHGIRADTAIDWPALMTFKHSFTDPVPADRQSAYERAGIAALQGQAHFLDARRLAVGDRLLEAKHFVIATGARPRPLGIVGEQHVATSTDFLALPRLPRRIAFIGAGYVSFELGHLARRAGAEVTIVGRGAPLAHFERDLVDRLVAHTRSLGIDLRLESQVTAIGKRAEGFTVTVRAGDREQTVDADLVVHGAGRVPATEALDLAAAGVATDKHGAIRVNDYLQSETHPGVYAAGDVVAAAPGKLPLTPVAGYEGRLVATNLLEDKRQARAYVAIPSVVFTVPPLAAVGRTERQARAEQLDVRVQQGDSSGWYSNRRVGEAAAMYKVIIDNASDLIVGAHLLGPHTEELINLFALAMRHRIPARDLKEMQYAYPSASSDLSYMV